MNLPEPGGRPRPRAPDRPDDPLLAGQVGAEVAAALSSALERVRLLAATGRIGRASLAALLDELRQARQVAMIGQQVSRLAGGQVRQAPEVLDLAQTLRVALGQRRDEIAARGLEVRQRLQPASVQCDASLLFTLLVGLLDWAFEQCRGAQLLLSAGMNPWPVHAVLRCEFAWRAPDRVGPEPVPVADGGPSPLDTMAWRLLEHSARALGVRLAREQTPQRLHVELAFGEAPRRWPRLVEDADEVGALAAQPLAGSELLVLATQPGTARLVREATAGLGLVLQLAPDLGAARARTQAAPPHALLVDARRPEIDRWITELQAGGAGPALLHLGEGFRGLEISTDGRFEILRLARDEVVALLPQALAYALDPR